MKTKEVELRGGPWHGRRLILNVSIVKLEIAPIPDGISARLVYMATTDLTDYGAEIWFLHQNYTGPASHES